MLFHLIGCLKILTTHGVIKAYFQLDFGNSSLYPEHIALSALDLSTLKLLGVSANNNIPIGTKNFAKIRIEGNSSNFDALSGNPGVNGQSLHQYTFNHPSTFTRYGDSEVKGIQDMINTVPDADLKDAKVIIESMRPICPSCMNAIKHTAKEKNFKLEIREGKFPPN